MTVAAGYLWDEDRGFEAVVLLDDASQDSFQVQRSFAFDEQDVELGMDTYCLVRDGASHYGGVRSFGHDGSSVTFEFTDAAARALQLPSAVTITISPDQLEPVLPMLQRMLG